MHAVVVWFQIFQAAVHDRLQAPHGAAEGVSKRQMEPELQELLKVYTCLLLHCPGWCLLLAAPPASC